MKISTQTGTLAKVYGDEKAIVKLARAGFDAMDYSLYIHDVVDGVYSQKGFEKYAMKLKGIADAAGIEFGQIHAHMPSPSYPDYMARTEIFDKVYANTIISAAILDCPYVVIHPLIMLDRIYDYKYQENYDANIEFYSKLIPYLKEYNVKVAIENMWHFDEEKDTICPTVCSFAEEMTSLCRDLGDGFVTCLDVGHTVLTGSTPADQVRKLGDTLKVLHVHDNDGRDDTHDIIYNGNVTNMQFPGNPNKINWDEFMIALKEVGYDGTFSLEADAFIRKFPVELYDDALQFMNKVARYITNKHGM